MIESCPSAVAIVDKFIVFPKAYWQRLLVGLILCFVESVFVTGSILALQVDRAAGVKGSATKGCRVRFKGKFETS